MANIMGMALARYRLNNDVLQKGMFECKRLVMFASEDVSMLYFGG